MAPTRQTNEAQRSSDFPWRTAMRLIQAALLQIAQRGQVAAGSLSNARASPTVAGRRP
jgi:hypothetical protein